MPDTVETLITTIRTDLLRGFTELEQGRISVAEWYDETRNNLAIFHRVAWMAGQGSREMLPSAEGRVDGIVAGQLSFLEAFANEIADTLDEETASWATWRNRIQMYGDAVYATASQGKYQFWTLPAHPGAGDTQCLVRCRCAWESRILSDEELDGDFYWRLNTGVESCPDCVRNAQRWNPLRIRGGVMV